MAAAYGNTGDWARADSITRAVDSARARLAPLDRGLLDVWLASVRGDEAARYRAGKRMLADAPGSELATFIGGLGAMEVGRYDEAVRLLRRIPVERSGVAWDLYGTRLARALHLAGRHDEELAETRRRLARAPAWLAALDEHARALAASGRIAAVDSVLTEALALPTQGTLTPAVVMRDAAAELLAHGHPREAGAAGRRAAEWELARPPAQRATPGARLALARSLYYAGGADGLAAADTILRALCAERPDDRVALEWAGLVAARRGDRAAAERIAGALAARAEPYMHGENTIVRARIAAALGRRDDAVRLARQALTEGVDVPTLHTSAELLPLRGYAPFDALVRPVR
jgi:tetratricopeptide (TPR) repeat protein